MTEFKSLPKMQCFKTGGSVKAFTKRDRKETDSADIAQDKKIVKKALAMHDKQEHPGEKTDLSKLRKGGRAKKSVGTVQKYKAGGNVTNVYEAKKSAGDKDNIRKVKQISPTTADALSAAGKGDNTTAKFCGGKSVKKMADGGSTGLQQAAMLNQLPGKANEIERAQMAARAKNALKYLGPAQQAEFVKQGGMTPRPNANIGVGDSGPAPTGSTIPAGQKRGGKVKKMNTGGTCS